MARLIYSAIMSLDGFIADRAGTFGWAMPDPEVHAIVYSSTLAAPLTARTRVERRFDPDAVRALKASAAHDISIAGPTLATHAFHAGLVDECHLCIAPVVVGGGKPGLPRDTRFDVSIVAERRFAGGMLYLRCATDRTARAAPDRARDDH